MKKILVANRGEIALRVMRTAKEMGIKTVAVFSDVDRTAAHVLFADEAIHIGPSPSAQSYLLGERILEAAKQTGADGIHPGYGFLSENAEFAKQVTDAGIAFIGPSPAAIRIMGSKLAAKDAVKSYNIPMVPGTDKAVDDPDEAIKIAKSISFPILIKASAGGGGKGMRVVTHEGELKEQMERAISEAKSAFGDGSVFIEKYIQAPRHIEIQVLADNHGNVIHLFERECSIQRRHQKVVEEAPSVVLTPELREAMGNCAINVARSCNYSGAGTVEFLLDEDKNFYFLEMNTRLQVEHPVTEMITGVDLVAEQIRIARNEELQIKQSDLSISGHALELRVYAEDPAENFMPSIGTLSTYQIPKGPGVRVDDGYAEGMEIPIYYDPMIAKLITYGSTREIALQRMIRAIDEYYISGLFTTLPFGRFVMKNEHFINGNFTTNFVNEHFDPALIKEERKEEAELAASLAVYLIEKNKKKLRIQPSQPSIAWKNRRNH